MSFIYQLAKIVWQELIQHQLLLLALVVVVDIQQMDLHHVLRLVQQVFMLKVAVINVCHVQQELIVLLLELQQYLVVFYVELVYIHYLGLQTV